nr:bifunctional YncE family protein/alkaline phosphatase family protein [uncultured Rhodopila sp.]
MKLITCQQLLRASLLATTMLIAPQLARADIDDGIADNNGQQPLPTGQFITPLLPTNAVQTFLNPGLANYPSYVAGQAVKLALSPDGTTLAVITAGYNLLNKSTGSSDSAASTQFLFLYNVAGANKTKPVLKQVIQQAQAGTGLVWSPDGKTIYAAGGVNDEVYLYASATGTSGTYAAAGTIALGHSGKGVGISVKPNVYGLALSADGSTLVAVNNYNDSISVISTATKAVLYQHDLRPYFANNEGTSGVAGGEYPFAAVIATVGGVKTAYVSSTRDRQVVAVNISSTASGQLAARIATDGEPNGLALNAAQTTLYVGQDNSDEVALINTATNVITATIDTRAPAGVLTGPHYTGAGTNAVTLSPDGSTLYAVNGAANSVAVIPLTGSSANTVTGLIPTAWYPHDIAFSADGTWMYIINGKSDQGANPLYTTSSTSSLADTTYPGGNAAARSTSAAANQYDLQMHKASLISAQVPGSNDLPQLTAQVEANNFYSVTPNANDATVMNFLHGKIQHVIYIIKENRTFDQVLGDLTNGANGDPSLTVFGKRITPNLHRIATNFVTLDNFFTTSDVSMDGWSWSTQARVTDDIGLNVQLEYASRGLSYDSEAYNRGNVPTGLATTADRAIAVPGYSASVTPGMSATVADVLPGAGDVATGDSPNSLYSGKENGHIWDAVIAAGLTVRNYGFNVNDVGSIGTVASPNRYPYHAGTVMAYPENQTLAHYPAGQTLAQADRTDLYYLGFNTSYPDNWRVDEWMREFNGTYAPGYYANNQVALSNMPNLTLLRLGRDHMGGFGSNVLGNSGTPEAQQADNDYAVARVIDAVNHSIYANNTLIFVIEDDSQDGPDHMDAHRSTVYVAGPYVKQNAVVSTRYTTVNLVRTIEDVLGLTHLNLNDAYQGPMTNVFNIAQPASWSFSAVASTVLQSTTIVMNDPNVRWAEGPVVVPKHDGDYWKEATKGFDFSAADRVPMDLFNQVLWDGLNGGTPYPAHRDGLRKGYREVTMK